MKHPVELGELVTMTNRRVKVEAKPDSGGTCYEFEARTTAAPFPLFTALLYQVKNVPSDCWAVRINEIGPERRCVHNLERWFGGNVVGLGHDLSFGAALNIAKSWVVRQEILDPSCAASWDDQPSDNSAPQHDEDTPDAMPNQMTVMVEKIDLATNAMDHDVAVGRLLEAAGRLPAGSRVEIALNGGVGGQSSFSGFLQDNPGLADGSTELPMVFDGAYPTRHIGSVDRTALSVYAEEVTLALATAAIRL